MMTNHTISEKLWDLKKRGLFVNHQERELVASAARRLEEDAKKIAKLEAELKEARYLLAEREGIQEDDGTRDAAAPGEAAEDFWEDFWPTEEE